MTARLQTIAVIAAEVVETANPVHGTSSRQEEKTVHWHETRESSLIAPYLLKSRVVYEVVDCFDRS